MLNGFWLVAIAGLQIPAAGGAPDIGLANLLHDAPFVLALHRSAWMLPLARVLHIVAFSILVGSTVMTDLRILGLARQIPVRALHRITIPLGLICFMVIVPTGLVLFTADAGKIIANPVFLWKMLLLFAATINAMIFVTGPYQSAASWDVDVPAPAGARLCAGLSMALWIAVLCCGRLIAYV